MFCFCKPAVFGKTVLISLVLMILFGSIKYCLCVCFYEAGVSEAWTSRSCKCDCDGGESPTEFSSIGTGSSMVRGVDCMPGAVKPIKYIPLCQKNPQSCLFFGPVICDFLKNRPSRFYLVPLNLKRMFCHTGFCCHSLTY